MKKIIFIVCIILPLHNSPRLTPLHIDSKILSMVDGHPRLIRMMADLTSFQRKIQSILNRTMPTKRIPHCTFQRLVALEDELTTHERNLILQKFISQFAEMREIETFAALNVSSEVIASLIQRWQQQRNRHQSLLPIITTNEYKADHKATFMRHIASLRQFQEFLEDLDQFSIDLMQSLPLSSARYYEALRQINEHHESTTSR